MDTRHFVVHIPHDSMLIPDEYRDSFIISDRELRQEQLWMTDAWTKELFSDPENDTVRIINPVSRLLCDVERFRDDRDEYNAKHGQGLLYLRGAFGRKLRDYDEGLRSEILEKYYDPHHKALTEAVDKALAETGRCTILDGHSFNSVWPVRLSCLLRRPDFCIGTDDYHTPEGLAEAMADAVREEGFYVRFNTPYYGAITPIKHYGKDKRVSSVMVEVNRRLYMDEKTGEKNADFDRIHEVCVKLMRTAAGYEP